VDSTSSPRVARLLGAQALLCLRIDRWERIGAPRSTRVYVDMTATLVDSTGRLLWRASSEERLESIYSVPRVTSDLVPPSDEGTGQNYALWREVDAERQQRKMAGRPGEMGMTTQSAHAVAADFRAGLSRSLARLAARFPESPRRPGR
jgi:hypothetical protein